ncbi:MAG: hypothetical protein J7M25_07705 [Deltaproteobacteria bacterium]|nr:hypothetical protein [Deltaproteobacteria bacterium]
MAKSKLKLSGTKLKMVAGMVESGLVGPALRTKVMRQMGLDAIWDAHLDEEDAPALVLTRRADSSEEKGEEA